MVIPACWPSDTSASLSLPAGISKATSWAAAGVAARHSTAIQANGSARYVADALMEPSLLCSLRIVDAGFAEIDCRSGDNHERETAHPDRSLTSARNDHSPCAGMVLAPSASRSAQSDAQVEE